MMKSTQVKYFLFSLFILAAHAVQGQVSFTINAGVLPGTGNNLGYVAGPTPVSFTFTTVANTTVNGNSFTGTLSQWIDTGSSLLWTSVTGDGLSGTYNPGDPAGTVGAQDNTFLFEAVDDSDGTIGISANGNAVRQLIGLNFSLIGLTFTHSGSPSTPEAYFSSYVGTHNVSPGSTMSMTGVNAANSVNLLPLSVEIAVVPEPSAYAAILGGVAFALIALIRRSGSRMKLCAGRHDA